MQRLSYIFFLILWWVSFLKAADETLPGVTLIHSAGLPSCLVNGVNVISGDYMEARRDISIEDAAPLALESYYNSTNKSRDCLEMGWRHNQQGGGYLILENSRENSTGCRLGYREPVGNTTRYVAKYPKGTHDTSINMPLWVSENRGIINCYQEIGGHTNYKNCLFTVTKSKRALKTIEATTSAGSKIEFKITKSRTEMDSSNPQAIWEAKFLPIQERRPNRQHVIYSYEQERIKQVTSTDVNDQPLNWLSFSYGEMNTNPLIAVTSSDGRQALYHFTLVLDAKDARYNHWRLTKTIRSDGPTELYSYIPTEENGLYLLSCTARPEGRHKIIDYYPKYAAAAQKIEQNKGIAYRVRSLQAPVGVDQHPVITHKFSYRMNSDESGTTSVTDALGRLTQYAYDKDLRLKSIERYCGKNLHSVEAYTWGEKGTTNEINLLKKTIKDAKDNAIFTQFYSYDIQGNVLADMVMGNLSGNRSEKESYKKTYTYANNSYHLLESASEENGLRKTLFSYDTDSNLLLTKFICENNTIKKREFFAYNEQSVVTVKICDDGNSKNINDFTGVTERHITYIKGKSHAPGVGLPEIIITKYHDLNTGKEQQLKRIFNLYSPTGKLIRQDHYDSLDQFVYTLLWQYDSFGNVIFQKDALGNTITRQYDANGNLIRENGPRPDLEKTFTYDFSNRLICEEEKCQDGTHLITTHNYDFVGNRIATCDPYGQITRFFYDDFNKLIKTELPQLPNSQGELYIPTTYTEYDILGFVSATVDPNGCRTEKCHTVRGAPFEIRYPDGTQEFFTYTLSGFLKSHITREGVKILYTYDYLDRITQEDTFSPTGQFLKKISHTYNAYHLLSTTDPEGYKTVYTYDGAGRLSSQTKEGRTITYSYDSLGRKHKQTDSQGSVIYLYDNKDQVIEERIENLFGNILIIKRYQYDIDGNQTHIIEETSLGQAVTETQYNCQNQPTLIIDALGHTSHITYNHHHINNYGQKVLQKTSTDPLGQRTLITYDTHGKEATLEKYSSYGELLAKEERLFDACGRLVLTQHTVIIPDKSPQNIITTWDHNSMGQVIHLAEAVGTQEEKHTRYHYNILGQKDLTIKPDGIQIHQNYDSLGRLSTISSSDHTISYQYTYNLLDLPVKIEDILTHKATLRTYNGHGEMTQETLAHGFLLHYAYDNTGRLQTLTLPDKSTVDYTYDALFLRQVSYKDSTHQYTHYDLAGNLLLSHTQIGDIIYTHDPLHRITDIQAPHFTETAITYDSVGNMIKCIDRGISYEYSYDALYQLTKENAHTYTHDSLYNRRKKDAIIYQINALNQLTEAEHKYHYDQNGNLLEIEDKVTCTYDAWDRLITLKIAGKTFHYTYDAFNRRLSKTSDKEIQYLYADQREIGCYEDRQLKELRILGRGRGAEIGASIAIYLEGHPYIPIHDHNGNITTLVDAYSGALFESYRYTAFGEEENSRTNPWGFASKRKDPDTGWIAFGRRDYDPSIGRWLTSDPQGFEDGPNLYAYLYNNPLTHIDLWGLEVLGSGSAVIGERYSYSSHQSPSSNLPIFGTGPTFYSTLGSAMTNFGKGFAQAFLNPLEVSSAWVGYGKNIYNGSFATSWERMTFIECIDHAGSRTGEGLGLMASAYTTLGGGVTQGIKSVIKTIFRKGVTDIKNSGSLRRMTSDKIPKIADQPEKIKKVSHPRIHRDPQAEGAHTVFTKDASNKIKRYETFQPQTNPHNRNPWETVKRYDLEGTHYSKHYEKHLEGPHIHDPQFPGKVRYSESWEVPK